MQTLATGSEQAAVGRWVIAGLVLALLATGLVLAAGWMTALFI